MHFNPFILLNSLQHKYKNAFVVVVVVAVLMLSFDEIKMK